MTWAFMNIVVLLFYRTFFMLTAARKKILGTNKREYLSKECLPSDKYL